MSFYSFALITESEKQEELLRGWVYRLGWAGLEVNNERLVIYFQADTEKESSGKLNSFLEIFPKVHISQNLKKIKNENWNENWKKYFKSVQVGQFYIQAPWHKPSKTKLPIIISPKMAFGTGTHETTQLILEIISKAVVSEKKILDIGCGSGILSVAAEKMGALEVLGLDIDKNAIDNARENAAMNNTSFCRFSMTPVEQIKTPKFEVIFANIIASVLLRLAGDISRLIIPGGKIYLSGLLKENLDEIEKKYKKFGFKRILKKIRNEWFLLAYEKEN